MSESASEKAAKKKQAARRWRRKNKAKREAGKKRNREKRKVAIAATDDTTPEQIAALMAQKLCHFCKQSIRRRSRTIEHLTPLSRGGGHTLSNLAMACRRCNTRKGRKTEKEYDDYLSKNSGGQLQPENRSPDHDLRGDLPQVHPGGGEHAQSART